jgi:hypothetical protein
MTKADRTKQKPHRGPSVEGLKALFLHLTAEEHEALQRAADEALRSKVAHARWLLRIALGLEQP